MQGSIDYFRKALLQADYLARGATEEPGYFWGRAAELLGLQQGQAIDEATFVALLKNQHPQTGDRITPRIRKDRIPGYEIRIDMPKSATVMALYDPEILSDFRAAVQETLELMQKEEMRVRVDEGGKKSERKTKNLLAGLFFHSNTRPVNGVPDFQPHVHAFVLNFSQDIDGRFKAGQFRELKHAYYQEVYHNLLASRLLQRGYRIESTKDAFEIVGVPASVREKHSNRRNQILDYLEDQNLGTSAKAKQQATLATQEKKNDRYSQDELREIWLGRHTQEEEKALADVLHNRNDPGTAESSRSITEKEAVAFAIEHSFAKRPVVTEKQLLAEALKQGRGQLNLQEVKRELHGSGLIFREHQHRLKATRPTDRNDEATILRLARQGRGRFAPLGGQHWSITPSPEHPLNRDQLKAIRMILGSTHEIQLLRGSPGTGKTSLLKTAVAAIEQAGTPVFAVAPTTRARDELRKDGFAAETLQMLLKNPRLQSQVRGSLVILDEAGLAATRETKQFLELIHAQRGRALLVGDDKQHGPVGSGRPFTLLQQHSGLPVAEVREIVRQQHQSYRHAVSLIDQGRVSQGLDVLDRLGWVREENGAKRYHDLAQRYVELSAHPKSSVIVVAPRHVEKDAATQAIRAALRQQKGRFGSEKKRLDTEERSFERWVPLFATEAERGDHRFYAPHPGLKLQLFQNLKGGFVKGDRLTVLGVDDRRRVWVEDDQGEKKVLPLDHPERWQVYELTQIQLARGDRIRITNNGKTLEGGRISNGTIASVEGFDRQGNLRLGKNRTLDRAFAHVDYGYAVTSIASQGRTVQHVLIAQSTPSLPASFRNQLLVSVSRGRKSVAIFTDNKEQLKEAVQRTDQQLSATDFLRETNVVDHQSHRERLRRLAVLGAQRVRQTGRDVARFLQRSRTEQERGYEQER